jgi:hypothetical protein
VKNREAFDRAVHHVPMWVGARNVTYNDKSGCFTSDNNRHMCRDQTCPRRTHNRCEIVSLKECLDLTFIDDFECLRDVHRRLFYTHNNGAIRGDTPHVSPGFNAARPGGSQFIRPPVLMRLRYFCSQPRYRNTANSTNCTAAFSPSMSGVVVYPRNGTEMPLNQR